MKSFIKHICIILILALSLSACNSAEERALEQEKRAENNRLSVIQNINEYYEAPDYALYSTHPADNGLVGKNVYIEGVLKSINDDYLEKRELIVECDGNQWCVYTDGSNSHHMNYQELINKAIIATGVYGGYSNLHKIPIIYADATYDIENNTKYDEYTTEYTQEKAAEANVNYNNIYLPTWASWGMNIKEAQDNISYYRTLGNDKESYLTINPVSTDYFRFGFEYVYAFSNNRLTSYFIKYDGTEYFSTYDDIKRVVSKKYGSPSVDRINWTDETYKSDESKWSDAFKYGHVNMYSEWNLDNGTVAQLSWSRDNMYLEYIDKDSITYKISK